MRLVLASANPDKLHEVRSILAGGSVEIISIIDLAPSWDCDEPGETIEENALAKAVAAVRATGLPCIADDTGLFVSGLGGAPGIYTARFAGSSADYSENVRKLTRVLKWEEGASRGASFRTAAAYAEPSGRTLVAVGRVEGMILDEPRGDMGFGYDPVFFVPALGLTYAECPADVKNRDSHRARAFLALLELIG
jgi:XTP/dITP diphosphohydrolase